MIVLKILFVLVCIFAALFLLSLIIYFFNLDMKLASKMLPIMNYIYDKGKEKRERKKKS